ncbi:helix-turn-helix transcriptional regulator [Psychrobacillus sp. L3]|uniref:helix-turn-helix transcriptional regulator n=1 Tax=Psychrobacillus sp. L3 TaxID=3236891 RepID=UPI0036F1C74C
MEQMNGIVAERRTYTSFNENHFHCYGQLILPIQGELCIQAESKELLLDPEIILFVPPECDHTFHSDVRNEFLILDIPSFMFTGSGLQNRVISCKFNNQWRGIRYLILNEIDQPSFNGSALKELYPYISRYLFQEQQSKSIRYIHEHYDENITVQDLASMEHYNRSYYTEWFFKETGKSPSAYIQEVRINKAKELLCNTDLPILHIAIQVGLEHQSSLTRLFQKYEELTPSQFRKKNLRI